MGVAVHVAGNEQRYVCFYCNTHSRTFRASAARAYAQSKKGGNVNIDRPSQHVLERTSVLIADDAVECRFTVALPAVGVLALLP